MLLLFAKHIYFTAAILCFGAVHYLQNMTAWNLVVVALTFCVSVAAPELLCRFSNWCWMPGEPLSQAGKSGAKVSAGHIPTGLDGSKQYASSAGKTL